ncbi:unnamed protein product, partial [Discosporangium mesarthrocarpum]
MGPGGLDPIDVFESLPSKMQEAFETHNTPLLKEALSEMTVAERRRVHHMKRCEASGLWVVNGGQDTLGKDDEDEGEGEGEG